MMSIYLLSSACRERLFLGTRWRTSEADTSTARRMRSSGDATDSSHSADRPFCADSVMSRDHSATYDRLNQ